jgi:Ras-related protein Rab-1A
MSSSSSTYDYLFKIVLAGNSSVGKSSLILKFVENTFKEIFLPTIGIDFKLKTLTINDKRIKLQIWDTAGQDRFKTVNKNYYRGAHGILLMYDITQFDSFKNLNSWLIEIEKNANKNVVKLLVGNKVDLENERKVTYQQGNEFAASNDMLFIETSVKEDVNVTKAFENLGEKLVVLAESESECNGGECSKTKKKVDLNCKGEDIDFNIGSESNKKKCC